MRPKDVLIQELGDRINSVVFGGLYFGPFGSIIKSYQDVAGPWWDAQ